MGLSRTPIAPSDFYDERIRRLKAHFDVATSERAKELLIDAICDEVPVNQSNSKGGKPLPFKAKI